MSFINRPIKNDLSIDKEHQKVCEFVKVKISKNELQLIAYQKCNREREIDSINHPMHMWICPGPVDHNPKLLHH